MIKDVKRGKERNYRVCMPNLFFKKVLDKDLLCATSFPYISFFGAALRHSRPGQRI